MRPIGRSARPMTRWSSARIVAESSTMRMLSGLLAPAAPLVSLISTPDQSTCRPGSSPRSTLLHRPAVQHHRQLAVRDRQRRLPRPRSSDLFSRHEDATAPQHLARREDVALGPAIRFGAIADVGAADEADFAAAFVGAHETRALEEE